MRGSSYVPGVTVLGGLTSFFSSFGSSTGIEVVSRVDVSKEQEMESSWIG